MYRTGDGVGEGFTSLEASRPRRGSGLGSQLGRAIKRAIDLTLALLLLVALLPLFAFIAIGVKCSSPGPAFYVQPRVGRNGRQFAFYKFRSMQVESQQVLNAFLDSDPELKERWNKYQKIQDDPRITRFGRFLRRTSLDELPQLVNVIKGDMSLVGPRPCIASQSHFYGADWDSYCSVRPGLTGLWQVSGRNRLTYQQRVELDSTYVQKWSLGLDFRILLRTFKVVMSGDGSH